MYVQLAAILRDAITSGQVSGSVPLPSRRSLVQQYGISERTVNSALDLLRAEGLIEFRPGRGLFAVPEDDRPG
jgi:GntR family transcriptional regulator